MQSPATRAQRQVRCLRALESREILRARSNLEDPPPFRIAVTECVVAHLSSAPHNHYPNAAAQTKTVILSLFFLRATYVEPRTPKLDEHLVDAALATGALQSEESRVKGQQGC